MVLIVNQFTSQKQTDQHFFKLFLGRRKKTTAKGGLCGDKTISQLQQTSAQLLLCVYFFAGESASSALSRLSL